MIITMTQNKLHLNPFIPMEPISTTEIPDSKEWAAQIKWDGVRILTYYDGETVRLYNRKLRERTFHYPELSAINEYCPVQSVILDGEIIALGQDGKPSFHEVMKRDGIRRLDRVKKAQREVPVTYMVFDVIFYNGAWLKKEPFVNRMEFVAKILKPNDNVQIVSTHEDTAALFDVVKSHDLEGIVLKRLDSPYLIGEKRSYWQKLKNYQDLNAVIGGFTLRGNMVNSLLLGLYDNDRNLHYIGHAGTGKLSSKDWAELTKLLKPLTVKEIPFINRPQRSEAFWVKPLLTVKIQFMEWTDGRILRQPSIQALVNVPPEECIFNTL